MLENQSTKDLTNIEALKKLSKQIVEDETKELGLKVNYYPLTIVEYYKSEFFKENLKLFSIKGILRAIFYPNKFQALYSDVDNIIIVFFNNITTFKIKNTLKNDFNHKIIKFLIIIYHELRHAYQDQKFENYVENELIYLTIESILIKFDHTYYKNNSDKFFIEKDANLYGAKKAKIYVDSHLDMNLIYKKYVSLLTEMCGYDFISYDFRTILTKFNALYKKNHQYITNKFFRNLYDENGNPRNIDDILKKKILENSDLKTLYLFLTHDDFLNKLDITKLDEKSTSIIQEALMFMYLSEMKRKGLNQKFLDDGIITTEDFFSLDKVISDNMTFYNSRLLELVTNKTKIESRTI